eukprot:2600273-Pyramimonas_sp.AAC.1
MGTPMGARSLTSALPPSAPWPLTADLSLAPRRVASHATSQPGDADAQSSEGPPTWRGWWFSA